MATLLTIFIWFSLAGTKVEFYIFSPSANAAWVEELAGACTTNQDGYCEMRVRAQAWPDGLVRGELRWGDGQIRPVIAPATARLEIDLRSDPGGDLRYDSLPTTQAPPIQRKYPIQGVLMLFFALLFLAISLAIYRAGRTR
jgi:hypothetical protein